jgi:predicted nucleic acid-binding protein
MPEGFLFDTVACSRWRRGDRMLRRRIEALPMDAALYTSVISVGQNDYWIAAIALTHNLVLITNDPDFNRIQGLPKDNWLV